jgi:proteasome lid subunit RPN8/RPN11
MAELSTDAVGQPPSLDPEALETVVSWQKAAGAFEVCGFCVVDECGTQRALQLANRAGSIGEFEISRAEEEVLRAAITERRWRLVAFLHTHPDDAPDMSSRDRRCFEADTLPWIIVGTPLTNPCARTFMQRRTNAEAQDFDAALR